MTVLLTLIMLNLRLCSFTNLGLVLQPPFPCASPFEEKGSADNKILDDAR